MKNFLYKEWKLAFHPAVLMFWLLSVMLMIPNYPYFVILFYTMLGIFFISLNGRENHDILYSMSLPSKKSDFVKARFAFVVSIEMIQLLVAIPFIALKQALHMSGNVVGMDANLSFLAFSLVIFGIINWVFLKRYFTTPEKVGKTFAIASVYIAVVITAAEVLVHVIPFVRDRLDTPDPQFLLEKMAALAIGAVIYAALTFLSMKRSIGVFETLDI